MSTHPSNAALADVLASIGHLPICWVRWVRSDVNSVPSVTVGMPTCDAYRAACDVLRLTPGPGRLLREHRVYDAISRDGVTVIEHRCWPHHDCWGTR